MTVAEIILGSLNVLVLLAVGIYGAIITKQLNDNSIKHFNHTEKIANDRMLKELFTEFNQRFDRVNNKLDKISRLSKKKWEKLEPKKKERYEGIIIDFFNICAEEYHWHYEGRINGNIWVSWSKGMNDIYDRSEIIQELWRNECKKEGYKSYYINAPDAFFEIRNV